MKERVFVNLKNWEETDANMPHVGVHQKGDLVAVPIDYASPLLHAGKIGAALDSNGKEYEFPDGTPTDVIMESINKDRASLKAAPSQGNTTQAPAAAPEKETEPAKDPEPEEETPEEEETPAEETPEEEEKAAEMADFRVTDKMGTVVGGVEYEFEAVVSLDKNSPETLDLLEDKSIEAL